MTTEIVNFETPELLAIEKSKAKQIKETFEPMVKMLETFEESFNNILSESKEGITKELTSKAKRLRLDVGKIRIDTGKLKDKQKEYIKLEDKAIMGVHNLIVWAVTEKEDKLKEIEDYFETQEKLRLETLQKDRAELLSKYVDDAHERRLSDMDEDVWNAYISTKKKEYEDRIEAEKQAELQRIENERIVKQRNERSRLLLNITGVKENPNMTFSLHNMLDEKMSNIVDFKDVLDCDEKTFTKYFEEFKCTEEDNVQYLENQRLENERLKKEAEAKEKALEKERLKAKAESDKLKAENEAKLKKEQEAKAKLEAELKAKKDAEIKAENERKQAELKAKAEAEKLAKAPIKNQLNNWVDSFELPTSNIEHYKIAIIDEKFKAFKVWAKKEIELI